MATPKTASKSAKPAARKTPAISDAEWVVMREFWQRGKGTVALDFAARALVVAGAFFRATRAPAGAGVRLAGASRGGGPARPGRFPGERRGREGANYARRGADAPPRAADDLGCRCRGHRRV